MSRLKSFKLYESEGNKTPTPEQISFMKNLYDKIIDEIEPVIPSRFKIDYDKTKGITIGTGKKSDLKISIRVSDDKMILSTEPAGKPTFEINYNFGSANVESIIKMISKEFEDMEEEPEKEAPKPSRRVLRDFQDEDDDIDTPIETKPKRTKRSIEIKIIKGVLEDAYIMDDIELNTVTVDELVRRMLSESRKK